MAHCDEDAIGSTKHDRTVGRSRDSARTHGACDLARSCEEVLRGQLASHKSHDFGHDDRDDSHVVDGTVAFTR